jgi:hypothetical protein
MPTCSFKSHILEPRWLLRHSSSRPSVTARCAPTSSRLEQAVEEPPPISALAAKEDLERAFRQDSAVVKETADGEAALGRPLYSFCLTVCVESQVTSEMNRAVQMGKSLTLKPVLSA